MSKMKSFYYDVQNQLFKLYNSIGIDKPVNHEDILDFVMNDIIESADPFKWHSGDVAIAFRRWIEQQTNPMDSEDINSIDEVKNEPFNYFKVIKNGYNDEIKREEVQIHGGENANILLVKTDDGFTINVYSQSDLHSTMTIWEEDIE